MPELTHDTNLIIAGTNKSGTTALFRYLGDHPAVILSKFKESEFFLTPVEDREGDVRESYQSQFLGNDSEPKLFVEATPQYLHGGATVANRISSVLPDAKVLFVLRNPADRVISYFRSSYGQPKLPTYGIEFDLFVSKAIRAMQVDDTEVGRLTDQERAFRQELRISRYEQYLPAFVDVFGADNVLITFFDQLQSSPQTLMNEICGFLGIDSHTYKDYVFTVENQTRIHRSTSLQSVSGTLNARLEPMLNRFPSLRRAARHMYDLINVPHGQQIAIPDESKQQLEEFFAPWNAKFASWLAEVYPDKPFAGWRTK
jgi:hypothetical protein